MKFVLLCCVASPAASRASLTPMTCAPVLRASIQTHLAMICAVSGLKDICHWCILICVKVTEMVCAVILYNYIYTCSLLSSAVCRIYIHGCNLMVI